MDLIDFDNTGKLTKFNYPDLVELDKITEDLVSQISYWKIARPMDTNSGFEAGVINDKLQIPSYNEKLYVWINQCLMAASEFYFPKKNVELSICDSWMTRSTSGGTASSHSHQLSLLTGILYLTDNNSQTVFEVVPNEIDYLKQTLGDSDFENIKIPSEKGKLIIYPSRLNHRVRVMPGQTNLRYTYIFNTYSTGIIGNLQSSYLEYHVKDIKQRYEEGVSKLNSLK